MRKHRCLPLLILALSATCTRCSHASSRRSRSVKDERTMSRSYLDHAATTPMVPEAVEAVTRELTRIGNASSLHASGRSARRAVEESRGESREEIAAYVGAKPAEVIFTSGGTESDNLAIKGAFWAASESGRRGVVTSMIEHHAVLVYVACFVRPPNAGV